jgi:hypothetical protein
MRVKLSDIWENRCSAHPGYRCAHPGYVPIIIPDSIVKQLADMPPRSRDMICPSLAPGFTLLEDRGRREDRVRAAPAISCAKMRIEDAHEHTGSAEAVRPSLRDGLQLISCSPRRDQSLLVTVAPKKRELLGSLTPAIGASGPHDFAVRVMRPRRLRTPRPPHPTARS